MCCMQTVCVQGKHQVNSVCVLTGGRRSVSSTQGTEKTRVKMYQQQQGVEPHLLNTEDILDDVESPILETGATEMEKLTVEECILAKGKLGGV